MTKINPTIRFMTPEETRTTKLMNAGSVIVLGKTTIPIAAGRSDKVHVFFDSTVLYVLSINRRHEYVGLEIFDATSGEEYDSIFLQHQSEIQHCFGDNWLELEPIAIAKILNQFWI